jgi:hypothetical protein
MTYDLRRLRRKGFIQRIPRTQRYELTREEQFGEHVVADDGCSQRKNPPFCRQVYIMIIIERDYETARRTTEG